MKGVIITGTGGGIGAATAELLASSGYGVIGMQRRVTDESAKWLESLGGKCIKGDVTSAADRDRVIEAALSEYGNLYALVNVAGVGPRNRVDLLEMTEESYDEVMDINLKSVMFFCQSAAQAMLQTAPSENMRGAIVNISSISAYASSITRGEYCISKAGLSMVTKLFADRLAPEGILVNEIRPGIIQTGMTEKVKEKYDAQIAGGLLPIARWGLPIDVAKAVLALIDGQFPYTTGQAFDVDGGFHLRRL